MLPVFVSCSSWGPNHFDDTPSAPRVSDIVWTSVMAGTFVRT